MAWDDDKSTAVNPDNPDPDEVLSADEWNTHTTDQLSRLEYGELSNRPAASERSDGALWMDEHGRISRVDSNSWVVMSFGDSANKIPGTSQFDTVAVDTIDGGVASEAITDLEGNNLSVDSGSLTAAGGGGGGLGYGGLLADGQTITDPDKIYVIEGQVNGVTIGSGTETEGNMIIFLGAYSNVGSSIVTTVSTESSATVGIYSGVDDTYDIDRGAITIFVYDSTENHWWAQTRPNEYA